MLSVVTFLFLDEIWYVVAQNICQQELNKASALNLTFDVNWCACMQ